MAKRPTSPPVVDIAAARGGEVCTLAGTVRRADADLLTSPLSQRPCVYWEVNRAVGDPGAQPIRDLSLIGERRGRVGLRRDQVETWTEKAGTRHEEDEQERQRGRPGRRSDPAGRQELP